MTFMSLNHELSSIFSQMAAVMEIKGEPVFKAIAFGKVSRLLKDMTQDLGALAREGKLKDVEGIGASSRKIIEQYVAEGRSTDYEELINAVPAGLLPMLEIPGLGPKTIALFWKQRGVASIEDLVKALDAGTLSDLKGIGEKKLEQIKQGIALRSASAGRVGIVDAMEIADALAARVALLPMVQKVEVAGSVRRRKETVGDVDLLCALKGGVDPAAGGMAAAEAFTQFPEVTRVLGKGQTKSSVLTTAGLQVDLRIVPLANFGAALQYFTGSKEHNVKLRGLAQDREMTLNEWGLYRLDEYQSAAKKKTAEAPAAKPVASATEAEIYAAVGLAYVEPELREDRGEIEAARDGKLPKLITLGDIRGDLHMHTTASDGSDSIAAMAAAAKAMGYAFIAITDHSKSQVIANGLSAERLLAHAKEIRKVGQRAGITILAGCEVDILVDGRLDFEDEVLAELDFVVASPHVSLRQEQDKATERLLRAIDNPYVNVIGHPTGRLIDKRPGLPLDFGKVFAAAAASGTALEINGGYPRLDLSDVHARAAVRAGAKISINTDSHSVGELRAMAVGLSVARRAWLTSDNVINCLSLSQLQAFIAAKRPK
jgi:DNA polymerase (family X)